MQLGCEYTKNHHWRPWGQLLVDWHVPRANRPRYQLQSEWSSCQSWPDALCHLARFAKPAENRKPTFAQIRDALGRDPFSRRHASSNLDRRNGGRSCCMGRKLGIERDRQITTTLM